ncbi:cytochrome c-type protein NapB [Escherichia coli]|nr:cytochrome c-type protein NapB [Escherichia coli]
MKSHELKKALCQWTAMLALVGSGAGWAANGVAFSRLPDVSGTQDGGIRKSKHEERKRPSIMKPPQQIRTVGEWTS